MDAAHHTGLDPARRRDAAPGGRAVPRREAQRLRGLGRHGQREGLVERALGGVGIARVERGADLLETGAQTRAHLTVAGLLLLGLAVRFYRRLVLRQTGFLCFGRRPAALSNP